MYKKDSSKKKIISFLGCNCFVKNIRNDDVRDMALNEKNMKKNS